jgi:hypothetical protein
MQLLLYRNVGTAYSAALPKDHQPFREASIVAIEGSETIRAGTLCMSLLWAAERRRSPQIRQVREEETSLPGVLL